VLLNQNTLDQPGGSVITRRTLIIYNFGAALLFAVIGALSLLSFDHLLSRPAALPPFDPASAKVIQEEPDIERLRSHAAFYFDLGRELKRARYTDTDTSVRDFRLVCLLLILAFAVGGAMTLKAIKGSAKQD
jgi:hypothetical protein